MIAYREHDDEIGEICYKLGITVEEMEECYNAEAASPDDFDLGLNCEDGVVEKNH